VLKMQASRTLKLPTSSPTENLHCDQTPKNGARFVNKDNMQLLKVKYGEKLPVCPHIPKLFNSKTDSFSYPSLKVSTNNTIQ